MNQRTVLDRLLDEVPIDQPPIDLLLEQGRAAESRKRRTWAASSAAAAALVLAGTTWAVQGLASSQGDAMDDPAVARPATRTLPVQVTAGASGPLLTLRGQFENGAAAWDPESKTVTFVPATGFSSSCPPSASAEDAGDGAVALAIRDSSSPGPCTADSQAITVRINDLGTRPIELRVTMSEATERVPVIGGLGDEQGLVPLATDDGKQGFAYIEDMVWQAASSPAEARKLMREHVEEDGTTRVPVYKADGETLIGYFTAGQVN